MALIQPTDTPELWRVEAATETVSGETQINDATGAGNASTVISGAGEVEFMAAAVAAVGTLIRCPRLVRRCCVARFTAMARACCTWCGRIIRARTMIPKPFRRFSFATVRTPAGRWTGLLASRSASARCASTAATPTAAFRRM